MDNINTSLEELISALHEKCPKFQPAVFPFSFRQNNLSIMSNHCIKHYEKIKRDSDSCNDVAFVVNFDIMGQQIRILNIAIVNENDALLNNLELMMKKLLIAEDAELNILCQRFVELNGLEEMSMAASKIFVSEVYNIAYAIKVLISNIPGMEVSIGNSKFPINLDILSEKFLTSFIKLPSKDKQLVKRKTGKINSDSDSDSSIESEDDEDIKVSKKRRKRGKGKR